MPSLTSNIFSERYTMMLKLAYPNIDKHSMAVDRIWVDGEEVDSGGTLDQGETRSYSV